MKVRPASPAWAIFTLSALLLLLSIFTSDASLSIPPMVMLLFLSGEACVHAWRVRGICLSLAIKREVRPQILRQGSTARVRTVAELSTNNTMDLQIGEMLPSAAEIHHGSGDGRLRVREKGCEMEYMMRILGRGELRFEGVRIACRDLFFSSVHELRSMNFTEPSIIALPAHGKESDRGFTGGEYEVERATSPAGQTVREFRRFQPGDDIRRIDWKLSAKRGTTMVREFTGVIPMPSLLFLDLPADGRERAAFDRLVASVEGLLEAVLKSGAGCEVCIVSGANLIRADSIASDLRGWYRLQGGLECGEGHVPLIRYNGQTATASMVRELGAHLDALPSERRAEAEYLRRLLRLMRHASQWHGMLPYERQLATLLGGVAASDLYIFSLFSGDTSHIRLLVNEAAGKRHRVHLRVPESAMRTKGMQMCVYPLVQSIEAI